MKTEITNLIGKNRYRFLYFIKYNLKHHFLCVKFSFQKEKETIKKKGKKV